MLPFLGTIDVVKGLTLVIGCRAVGDPTPSIKWKRGSEGSNGLEVSADPAIGLTIDPDNTLRVAAADLQHAGQYTCVAENPAGKDSRSTNVIVQGTFTILLLLGTEFWEIITGLRNLANYSIKKAMKNVLKKQYSVNSFNQFKFNIAQSI